VIELLGDSSGSVTGELHIECQEVHWYYHSHCYCSASAHAYGTTVSITSSSE
jgi:hypothetical protein